MPVCSRPVVAVVLSLLLGSLSAFNGLGADRDPRSPGTIEMAERLRRINENMDFESNPYENARRVGFYQRKVDAETDPAARLELMRQHAIELLNAGLSLEAVRRFEDVERLEDSLADVDRENRLRTRVFKAVSWLRLGEQENCLSNHTTASCLLPIQGEGVHRLQRGSREGIKVLLEILEQEPDRIDARWLLNIACMTVGEYPDGVPARWRVPPERFESDYDIKPFRDVAGELGLDNNGVSGGTVMEDFNNDGFLDLLVTVNHLEEQTRVYFSRGDGTFEERTEAAGLLGLTGGLNAVQADYNNDGFVDVLILRGAWMGRIGRIPNSLLRNNGDGTFSDVTVEAGLRAARPTQTATFFDYDGDGWLDLFVGNETDRLDRNRVELFHNRKDGTFEEVSFECGIRLFAFVKGVVSGDYNNDGRPDLLVSIHGAPNQLWRNDGPEPAGDGSPVWKFTEVGAAAGIQDPVKSFPCWFFDYDNDGWEDIFFAGYGLVDFDDAVAELMGQPSRGAVMKVHRNRGDGTFEDVTQRLGLNHVVLAMGSNFGWDPLESTCRHASLSIL